MITVAINKNKYFVIVNHFIYSSNIHSETNLHVLFYMTKWLVKLNPTLLTQKAHHEAKITKKHIFLVKWSMITFILYFAGWSSILLFVVIT
jgi:hypothetical protein